MTESDSRFSPLPADLRRNRNFLFLWAAYGVSALGDHLSEMAVLKTLDVVRPDVDVTRLNARMVFLFFIPFFLLAPGAGWLADRVSRRGIMITADLIRGGMLFAFPALLAWSTPWGAWGPFVPLCLVGVFAAMFSPARAALLPTLIRTDQLVRANGMIAGLGIIATMAASLLGGYLAQHYQPTAAFHLNAVTFLISAVFVSLLHPPQHLRILDRRSHRTTFGDALEGFRYAAAHHRVRELLMIGALVWFCGAMVNSVIPAVVRDVYHGSYQAMSGYRAFLGCGFILGAVTISILGDALRSEITITWGLFGVGVSIAVFATSVFLPFSPAMLTRIGAVGIVGAGLFGVAIMASMDSLLQRIVPDRFRGRVLGIRDLCTTAALLLATGLLGVPSWPRLDRWVGVILTGVAMLTIVAGGITLAVRMRRSPFGPILGFFENLTDFVARFWWRLKVTGPRWLPREGPVIITANHRCPADPLFLTAAIRYRAIGFLVAEEYTHWKIIRWLIGLVECIPVRRGDRDVGATKEALRHLKAGKVLGVFIEGGIVPPGKVPKPRDGVAMLALRTGATVIPVHISGTKYHAGMIRGFFARHKVTLRFGHPVDLREFQSGRIERDTLRAATMKVFAAIQSLALAEEPNPAGPYNVRTPGMVEGAHESG